MGDILMRVCTSCGRMLGDHTLFDYGVCTKQPAKAEWIAERLGLDADAQSVADHLGCRAMVVAFDDGSKVPGVLLEFGVGFEGDVLDVVKVLYVADTPQNIRQLGRLVRDASNIAANAAEP